MRGVVESDEAYFGKEESIKVRRNRTEKKKK